MFQQGISIFMCHSHMTISLDEGRGEMRPIPVLEEAEKPRVESIVRRTVLGDSVERVETTVLSAVARTLLD